MDPDADDPKYAFTSEDAHWYQVYQICKEMHWTLAEYLSTPAHFNARVLAYLATEKKARDDKKE